MTIQKNIFHANKVDRIAIVDRPAVPDAEILVFKREQTADKEMSISEAFKSEFLAASARTAVELLEMGYWRALYSEGTAAEKAKVWKEVFKSFKEILSGILQQMPKTEGKAEKAQEQPAISDIVANFTRGLAVTAISETFMYFKYAVGSLVMTASTYKNPEGIAKALTDTFEQWVADHTEAIVQKSAGPRGTITEQRKLEMQKAINALTAIIEEATPQKNREEESTMNEEQVLAIISKALAPVTERISSLHDILTQKGIIEKQAEATGDKPTEEAKAEEKAPETPAPAPAEEKAKEEKPAEPAPAETPAPAEEEKKAEPAPVVEENKELKELQAKNEALEKQNKELVEKMAVHTAQIEKFDKAFKAFEKRTGHSVNLGTEETGEKKAGPSADPFAEVMKKKAKA